MAGIFYYRGQWFDEQPMIIGPLDHASWMSSVVFDGARAFDGMMPDLDLHCRRLIKSAQALMLEPKVTGEDVEELARAAVAKFPRSAELYIRPSIFAKTGFIMPDPDSAEFVLSVYESPLPPRTGFSACLSTQRRPARDMAPTDAKAPCLYPNSARAMYQAKRRGFDNAVMLDANGNVAEFATANLWIVRDGVAMTPMPNGTFLNGITRQRMIRLLREADVEVVEGILTFEDVMTADEIFSTGNNAKVSPVVRIEDRSLQVGPVARKAWDCYRDFAGSQKVAA